jgi:PEP-CTERM motif
MRSTFHSFRASALALVLLFAANASQAGIVYTLIPQLVGGSVAVSGSITTNGTIGILHSSDILAYTISLQQPSNPGSPVETLSSNTGAGFFIQGNYLTATDSAMSWNFAQGVGAEASLYGSNTITQWHLYTNRIDVDYSGIEYATNRNGVQQVALVVETVPEPSSWALLGVAFAGLLVMRKGTSLVAARRATV